MKALDVPLYRCARCGCPRADHGSGGCSSCECTEYSCPNPERLEVERDEARFERDALRAEVERLKAASPVVVGGFGLMAKGIQDVMQEVDAATRAALGAGEREQTDEAARRVVAEVERLKAAEKRAAWFEDQHAGVCVLYTQALDQRDEAEKLLLAYVAAFRDDDDPTTSGPMGRVRALLEKRGLLDAAPESVKRDAERGGA